MTSQAIDRALDFAKSRGGQILVLTGAGISAESGIPTFRGKEGYWRVGSVNYHPQELATFSAFQRMPEEVWSWYLFRRGACRAAQPNDAHRALAQLEQQLGRRYLLITQNVDGLHLRAGSSRERTYEVHGNIDFARCSAHCSGVFELPTAFLECAANTNPEWPKERRLSPAEAELLRCSQCGAWLRPHVLWFDESYDEALFRFESSLNAADEASLLLVIGTTGSTNLPLHVARVAARNAAAMLVLNPEPNAFSQIADTLEYGVYLQGTAASGDTTVAHLARRIADALRA